MPDDVRAELEERGVMELYQERPIYQRNDYLAWIGRADRLETRRKRIEQMLDELEHGGVYMKMDHPPSRRPRYPARKVRDCLVRVFVSTTVGCARRGRTVVRSQRGRPGSQRPTMSRAGFLVLLVDRSAWLFARSHHSAPPQPG